MQQKTNKILVTAQDFNKAAFKKLQDDLAASGVTNMKTIEMAGIIAGDYEGDLAELEALPNVLSVEKEKTFRVAPMNPRIPQ